MLNLSEKTKLKRLKELSEGEKAEIIIDAITTIGKFKGLAMADNEAIQIYDSMKYFIDNKYSLLHVFEVLKAFEKGMTGEYKQTFKFNADTLVFWLNEFHKETSIDKHRGNVYESNSPIINAPKVISEQSMLYAKAVFVRTCYDPGGIRCESESITLDMIAEELGKGINIFTKRIYSEKECITMANQSKSILFSNNKY